MKTPQKSAFVMVLLLLPLLFGAEPAMATSTIRNAWVAIYTGSQSYTNATCALCHDETGGPNLGNNAYGERIRQGIASGLTNANAIRAAAGAASIKSNGGCARNIDEIYLSTQPGWTSGSGNQIFDPATGALVTSIAAPTGIGTLDPAVPLAAKGDFNGDCQSDILWENTANGYIYAWLMNGTTATTGNTISQGVSSEWKLGGVGDFDGDGKSDLVWQNTTTGAVYVWLMDGITVKAPTTGVPIQLGVPLQWTIVGVGDFNADGTPDILWQDTASGDVYVWFMNGTTVTNARYIAQGMGTSWKVVAIADLNGDAKPDILWQNATTGDVYMWFMNGTTVSGGRYLAQGMGTAWQVVGTADLNADATPDILWQNATGDVYFWTINGNGTTVSGGRYLAQGMGTWKVVGPK
jgi:hypothetical protein